MKTNNEFKAVIKRVCGSERARASLEALGVNVKFERKLTKITNAKYTYRGYGAELSGGTCHYESGYYVSGKTFGIKEMIKSLGGKWKPKSKEWFFKPSDCKGTGELAKQILKLRAMASQF